jgi:hypothetical protein
MMPTRSFALKRAGACVAVLGLFLACYSLVPPGYVGDTTRYAADALGHAQGRQTQFWEFGHLLWRPWAYVGHVLAGSSYAHWFGDTPAQAVIRFLVHTNFVCSAAVLLLMLLLLWRVAGTWIAAAVVFAMSCAISFLNYSHSGTSYIPALLFSALALWLLVLAVERSKRERWYAVLAGLSFTVACALWFPFAFSGLGLLLVPFLWRSDKEREPRRRLAIAFLLTLAASALLLFTGAAAAEGIARPDQLSRWIRESDNGWSQSVTALRAVTGLPRSMWDFGGDTLLFKRWLFHDPYNSVNVWRVGLSLGWKLAVFYLGVAAAVWALWRERRALLMLLAAAGVPMLLFAIFLFEPSSPERFLPVFPFAFLAFAAVLESARRHRFAAACVAILLCSATLASLFGGQGSSSVRIAETRQRIEALEGSVQPGALVFVATLADDLYSLPGLHLLDHTFEASRFRVTDVVVIASRRTASWRRDFAERVQQQWAQHREVWVSERLLAARPEARWNWVEGDDPRIRWKDLPSAFDRLEFDARILPGRDGFLRLAETPANRDWLARQVDAVPEE